MIRQIGTSIASTPEFHPGVTSMVHKLDALLWAVGLETGKTQESIRQYADRVIYNLSDQGIGHDFEYFEWWKLFGV